jgi:hypothetical protein
MVRELRGKFPRDPCTSYYSALVALRRNGTSEAERQLKDGLAEHAILKTFFPDGTLESSMRALLAWMQLQRGDEGEARESFRPACATIEGSKPAGLDLEWVASVCKR